MKNLLIIIFFIFCLDAFGQKTPHEIRLQGVVDNFILKKNPKAYFASVYAIVTSGIRAKINQHDFENNHCMVLLIQEFLDRYFKAIDYPFDAPDAWKRAFEAQVSPSIHLLLGLNAHISHDLPLSMLQVAQENSECSPENMKKDYFHLNDFFHDITPELNRDLKHTYKKISFLKSSHMDSLSLEILMMFIRQIRKDAWNDFIHLIRSEEGRERDYEIDKIKKKALRRAKFYQSLNPLAPKLGL